MTNTALNKLVIIGVGLIGGSFALALREAGLVKHIVGIGRSKINMQRAIDQGVIDEIADDTASAMKDANALLLAMPVGQTTSILAQIAPHLEPETLITDAGSTKQDVISAARIYIKKNLKNFVPAHPIAGAEQSGVSAAQTNLFQKKHLILTPLAETSDDAIKRVTDLWEGCGAQVSQMQADEHDKILAATSHLPHILAFTLMNHLCINTGNNPDNLLRFAGSGFRDFTRIASSSPEMWRDICIANREALILQIDSYKNELVCLQKILENGDAQALKKSFTQARSIRQSWLKNKI
tara:strand:- start:207 stop:1091 length:885 start_codon:yes stop_codon:yes gene_type:complete